MTTVPSLLLGALAMGMMTIGLIFLRHWRDGGDRFFLFFALSFFVEGGNRIALAVSPHEGSPWQYGVRLFAYLLILVAIVEKNRVRTGTTER